jgi:hypothetical protein
MPPMVGILHVHTNPCRPDGLPIQQPMQMCYLRITWYGMKGSSCAGTANMHGTQPTAFKETTFSDSHAGVHMKGHLHLHGGACITI